MKEKLFLLHFFFIVFLIDAWCIADSNLASDMTALLAIRMAIGAPFLPWSISNHTPCNWTGVTCLLNRVVELRLQLDRFNAVPGQLPAEIGNLTSLRGLSLQGNLFSGEIPESLFNLQHLVSLDLAHNNFTGAISPNFNKLTKLASLCLEGNQLNGSIPYLNLASLEHFNVSFNKLTGLIPETLSSFPASSFVGNSLCGKPLSLCNTIGDNYGLSGSSGIAGIVIGCFIGCLCRRKVIKQVGYEAAEDLQHTEVDVKSEAAETVSNNKTAGSGGEDLEKKVQITIEEGASDSDHAATKTDGGAAFGVVKSSLEFDLEDLLQATAEELGKGTFGTTYKAVLETGRTVAIKRLRDFEMSEKEFEDMVEAIEKMNNQNLVPIRAYYYSEDQMLLVYEYMQMGSLNALLHGDKGGGRSPLSWEARTGIALGAARAIMHIHDIDPSMCHGNIKSSNVFLTATSKVRLSEFGLANVLGSTNIEGYLAPEVTDSGKVSQKADVYSFGILLLELITGKNPTESHLKDEGLDLSRWMRSAVNDEWTSTVFDVELLQNENVEDIMLQFLELTFSCTAKHPDNRPSMAEVINQIKKLGSSSLQADKDPAMNENVFGQIYKGPKAWKIFTRKNKELQQRFNSREDGNIEAKGLMFFGNASHVFDLEDLLSASAEVIGKGTFGATYRAILDSGKTICVKRVKNWNLKGEKFRETVEAVGKINHENSICLRAYCHNKDDNLLVQDYMPTGSLSDLLHSDRGSGRTPLNWETRCRIALGAARGIEYIHSQSAAMCHGRIKSSNILLTTTYEACVSDFGLANIAGDYPRDGYSPPEVTDASEVSQKADVYSFGVLLMELLTGKAPNSSNLMDEGLDLPRWIQSVVREEWTPEVFDIELLQYEEVEEDMVELLQIALSCICVDPDKRPSMTKLKFQIKKLIRPSSKAAEGAKSFEQTEDGKLRFGQMISIPEDTK